MGLPRCPAPWCSAWALGHRSVTSVPGTRLEPRSKCRRSGHLLGALKKCRCSGQLLGRHTGSADIGRPH
eukprot:scaffold35_cov116-Isochrysis_galbana.AAC.5